MMTSSRNSLHSFCCKYCPRYWDCFDSFQKHMRQHLNVRLRFYKRNRSTDWKTEEDILGETINIGKKETEIKTYDTSICHTGGQRCPFCQVPANLASLYQVNSNAMIRVYQCPQCHQCFPLETVGETVGSEPHYRCAECNLEFACRTSWSKHTVICKNKYSCSICGKRFSQKKHLKVHEQIHIQDRLFLCTECGRGFSTRSNLVRHKLTHTDIKPYKCEQCGRCFREKAKLVSHTYLHNNDGRSPRPKNFHCDWCGKRFAQSGHLSDHILTHTGDQPYECTHCKKRFSRSSNLKRHIQIHKGVKMGSG